MFLTSLSDPAGLDVYEFKKTLIYRYAITASGKKTVMKLCSMRRDEGIPPLKVMASLLGLQWRACITCDPSNHVCLFWDQKKSHPKAGETFFFSFLKLGIDTGRWQWYKEETQT